MLTARPKYKHNMSRRRLIIGLTSLSIAPSIVTKANARTRFADGIASGDITENSAIVWARARNSAKMLVEWSTTPKLKNPHRVTGPVVTVKTGYTGQVTLTDLPPGQDIFYRVRFNDSKSSETRLGHLRTPGQNRDITFVFGGDQCGAGWGINPDWGGLKLFETMRKTHPDFLIHLGDRIYSDQPILERASLPDGGSWRNIVTPGKSFVAESVDEYRGNYSYNFLDTHYRAFCEEVPAFTTWDDHEVTNNWWPGRDLSRRIMFRKGYLENNVDILSQNGRQAFFDFTPMQRHPTDPNRIFRKLSYGKNLDVFLLDSRSYRSPNNPNQQASPGKDTALLGQVQINWLKKALSESKALWKIIANPLPIAHKKKGERPRYDKFSNNDNGLPRGREFEIADILSHIKGHKIKNTVWLAADVHYSAAHHFHPDRSDFRDFLPFWEFIAGPFHTRPGRGLHYDKTFGAERYFRTPLAPKGNNPPSAGYVYFGHGRISVKTGILTVGIRDISGKILFEKTIEPQR